MAVKPESSRSRVLIQCFPVWPASGGINSWFLLSRCFIVLPSAFRGSWTANSRCSGILNAASRSPTQSRSSSTSTVVRGRRTTMAANLFPFDPVRNAEHDCLGDSGMFQEAILYLPRVDVLSVTDNEVATPTF